MKMSKIHEDIEDIKEYIKRNNEKISEVEDDVRNVNVNVNVRDIVELRESLARTLLNVKANIKGNSSNVTDVYSSTITNHISKLDNKLPFANTNMENTETPLDKKTSKR